MLNEIMVRPATQMRNAAEAAELVHKNYKITINNNITRNI